MESGFQRHFVLVVLSCLFIVNIFIQSEAVVLVAFSALILNVFVDRIVDAIRSKK